MYGAASYRTISWCSRGLAGAGVGNAGRGPLMAREGQVCSNQVIPMHHRLAKSSWAIFSRKKRGVLLDCFQTQSFIQNCGFRMDTIKYGVPRIPGSVCLMSLSAASYSKIGGAKRIRRAAFVKLTS